MLIEWASEYEIGLTDFDEQHKWLINLYNRIASALEKNSGVSIVGKYITSLNHYTEFHFGAEETALKKCGYPDFPDHKKQHGVFIDTVGSWTQKYHEGDQRAAYELLNFLRGWLLDHIMYEDRQYVPYLVAKAG